LDREDHPEAGTKVPATVLHFQPAAGNMETALTRNEAPIQKAGMKGTAIIIHEVDVAAINIIDMNIRPGIITK
jgi:hypothetical protein